MSNLARGIASTGIAIIVILSLFGFFQSSFFRATRLEVSGLDLVDAEEVRAMMDLQGNQHLFSFSLGEMEERIADDPRIQEARVARNLPGRLSVEVVEYQPVAMIVQGGVFALLNSGGAVLSVESTWPDIEVPVLSGLRVDSLVLGERIADPEVDRLLECAEMLGRVRYRISQVMLEEGYISLYTAEAAHIMFPVRQEEISRAVDILRPIMEERRLGSGFVIDLRVPDRPIIRDGNR